MGRFIDETELEKYIMHDGCEKGCGYIDERDLKFIPTVEAISKADYKARLKADLVAILVELQLEIEEIEIDVPFGFEPVSKTEAFYEGVSASSRLIQEKINALKAENKMN